ncbi:MAG: histidinol dehydrogenase [Actinomycetota bacterium]|nr:histidinol dehydrogenase [Actinomycetota bacterium]
MMPIIKIEKFDETKVEEFLARPVLEDEAALKAVRQILEDVRREGDRALLKYTKEFDGADLTEMGLAVRKEEIHEAYSSVGEEFVAAIRFAKERILGFHEKQKTSSWFTTEKEGIWLGQLIRPITRVGIYIPGGLASYPSTVLMNAIPASVAGVKEIAMCVPPRSDGKMNPFTLVAAEETGVDEIYKLGGAQAIAALAYGTETVKKVDKITGPGNIYVNLAKKLVVGHVGIDMLAGPSEVLILADEKADPRFIAADMLGQAEHAPDATALLITTSLKLAERVNSAVHEQLSGLKRREVAEESIKNRGRVFVVSDIEMGIKLANAIAPEHLELMVEEPLKFLNDIENAGAIFLGPYSTEALGDYMAGPNHVLPTGGSARFSSPLGVDDFAKKSSVLIFTKSGLEKLAKAVTVLAQAEGLEGHAKSVKIRVEGSE